MSLKREMKGTHRHTPNWSHRRSTLRPPGTSSLVPRNEKGGVLVTDEELKGAFEFFDVEDSGKITLKNLRKRLGVFYKHMPPSDYRFLMNKKDDLSLEDLRELLKDNEVADFDPVLEAFRAYDPDEEGRINPQTLRRIFQDLGYGQISDEDLDVLVEAGDLDKDGKIGLSDFRALLQRPVVTAAPTCAVEEEVSKNASDCKSGTKESGGGEVDHGESKEGAPPEDSPAAS